jgi:hypothetical protein
MERALAALAGSGLDSTRFAVLLDPGADLAVLDRSMTAVLAVSPGGLGAVLDRLNANTGAAWVADPHGDQRLDAGAAVEVMHGWHLGSVAELRSDRPADGDEAGWLVIEAEAPTEATDAELLGAIEAALKRGESPSRTAKAVAADFGVPKRRVYDLVLSLGGDR